MNSRFHFLVPIALCAMYIASHTASAQAFAVPAPAGDPETAASNLPTHPVNLMAMLTPANGAKTPTGMAMVNGTTVQLNVTLDHPGSDRVWHIHQGTCAEDKGIVGAADQFPAFHINENGTGKATATLAAPLAEHATFFVAVHASATEMKKVIACGNLKESKM